MFNFQGLQIILVLPFELTRFVKGFNTIVKPLSQLMKID